MAANLAALGGPSGVVGGGRPTGGNLVLNQETEQLKRDLDTYKARYVIFAHSPERGARSPLCVALSFVADARY